MGDSSAGRKPEALSTSILPLEVTCFFLLTRIRICTFGGIGQALRCLTQVWC